MFAGLMAGYLLQGILGKAEFPFVANSVAKDGLFCALCIAGAADVRRLSWTVVVVIAGHALLVVSLVTMLLFGDVDSVSGSFGAPPGFEVPAARTLLWIWLGLATATTLGLALLYRSASRARYELRYLSPLQYRTVVALAEVLVPGEDAALSPEEVGRGVDDYLFSFTAREKWKSKLALTALTFYPLVRLRPPWPIMSPAHRKAFIERCFLRDVAERRLPGFIRRAVQSMLFAAQQLVFIGYWSDPRSASSAGYVPFSRRPRFTEEMGKVDVNRPSVRARTPAEIDGDSITADAVIVGSGAGGAILAQRLAAAGREVVMLERGRHVDPKQFSEDEREQFSALFADGGLQMSTDARFQVLQGMCVGGTTVVNNAVCFDLPERVFERWNDPDGLDAGVEPGRLSASFARLRHELRITRQPDNGALNPSGRRFVEGARSLGLDRPPGELQVVEANIEGCLGCGYCNIGCAYGKKLSMLDWTLPRAQRDHGDEGVRVLAECAAERIETRNGKASGVCCRLSDGRALRVSAKTVVVSAGAIGSSLLLARSGLGGPLVGQGLGFNLGAPLTADFGERLYSYDGLQISHYLLPPGEPGLVLETWFNPVGAQALFMPGWFSDHYENMRRYDQMASAGSVVGTRRNATVRPGWRGKGMKLDYEPHPEDLARLVTGLKLAGRIFLAAGAERVMPTTYRYLQYTDPDQLDELDSVVTDNTDIQLLSSHPQGGNPLSSDPTKGVVGGDMRVHGFDNLFVCDASVFPSPITVNPQLTVMALADYAAPAIA